MRSAALISGVSFSFSVSLFCYRLVEHAELRPFYDYLALDVSV